MSAPLERDVSNCGEREKSTFPWYRVMKLFAPERFTLALVIAALLLFNGCAPKPPPLPDKPQASIPPPPIDQEPKETERLDQDKYIGGTIAVFNFENNTPDAVERMEFLSTWFSTRISETLSEQPAVTIVERNEIQAVLKELDLGSGDLANKKTSLQLGRLIAADFFVFGNYFILQEQLYCTSRLVDARSGIIIKSDEVLSEVENMSEVIEEISDNILLGLGRKVQTKIGSKETPEIAKLYIEGIQAMDKGEYEAALEFFTQVLEKDSNNRWARLRIKEILDK